MCFPTLRSSGQSNAEINGKSETTAEPKSQQQAKTQKSVCTTHTDDTEWVTVHRQLSRRDAHRTTHNSMQMARRAAHRRAQNGLPVRVAPRLTLAIAV